MLALQLLGGRGLWAGGRNLGASIHYRKGWALLGYLAVERGRRHSRADLAKLLWPTLEPGSARTNLRQVLANLNQSLDGHGGAGVLESDRDSVGLFPQPGTTIDLLALDTAESRLAGPACADIESVERDAERFGGEFLPGVALPDCDDFEDWLQLARSALGKRTQAVLARLCDMQRAEGRLPQAIATARRLLSTDEWNEDYLRLLMGLLAAVGQHAQALEAYEVLRTSLGKELDSEPEPRSQALRVRIEADRRRALPATGSAAPAVAGGMRRWFSDILGDRAVAGAGSADDDNDNGSDVNTGPMTQRTLPVTGPLHTPGTGWLEVVEGTGRGTRVAVTLAPLVIGRSRDSDLCMAHDTVSRHHCAVWREGSGFRIRDLGSTNRTRVNDATVEEAELGDGDIIMLGETMLRFCCGTG